MRLFIDDERKTPPGYTDSANTVEMAIGTLKRGLSMNEHLELVSFDYDAHSYKNWTFEAVLEWMRDNNVWPDTARIHTANDWHGRPWLENFLKEHGPGTMVIESYDPNTLQAVYDVAEGNAPHWVREYIETQTGRSFA